MKKYFVPICILIFISIGCSSQSENRNKANGIDSYSTQDAIVNFWDWFQLNEEKLRDFKKDENVIVPVYGELQKIDSNIQIEFLEIEDNIINVTFRGNEDVLLFPLITKIVAKAPQIKGWTFTAFRQRIPFHVLKGMAPVALEKYGIDITKFSFHPVIDNDSLEIVIHPENINEKNRNNLEYITKKYLINILGEYDYSVKVRSFGFFLEPLNNDESKSWFPMENLANYVDSFHNSLHN